MIQVTNGIGLAMLKKSTKQRRTKAEIQNQRMEEEQKTA